MRFLLYRDRRTMRFLRYRAMHWNGRQTLLSPNEGALSVTSTASDPSFYALPRPRVSKYSCFPVP